MLGKMGTDNFFVQAATRLSVFLLKMASKYFLDVSALASAEPFRLPWLFNAAQCGQASKNLPSQV
jgi:hypothetical protein